jgi:uncharacterized protein YbjT (DUF2867 family)
VILVTGATGGIGQALLQQPGPATLGVSRRAAPGLLALPDLECAAETVGAAARLAHEDRVPTGRLPTAANVANQLTWVIGNRSLLLSGATVTLSGGALP